MKNYVGYKGYYDCISNKNNKEQKLYKSVRGGIFGAVIGTYLADLVRNTFVERKERLFNIITDISPVDNYIGSTAGGLAGGTVRLYLNGLNSNSIAIASNKITTNYVYKSRDKNYLDDYELAEAIIFDTIAIGIILYVFGLDIYTNKDVDKPNVFFEQLAVFFVLNLYFIARAPFIEADLLD